MAVNGLKLFFLGFFEPDALAIVTVIFRMHAKTFNIFCFRGHFNFTLRGYLFIGIPLLSKIL